MNISIHNMYAAIVVALIKHRLPLFLSGVIVGMLISDRPR